MSNSTLIALIGLALLTLIVGILPLARRIVLLLTLKYLVKRRLAWVSLLAVTLCVSMVLVVLSVMSGWLSMFKSSFKTMSGDLVVSRESFSGFEGYDEIIRRAEQLPEVEAGVPIIRTAGLLKLPGDWDGYVGVVGIPMDRINRVMDFNRSLYLQHTQVNDPEIKRNPRTPSFDLWPNVPYEVTTPRDKKALEHPGLILGSGSINVKKNRETGKPDWPDPIEMLWAKLTVMPATEEVGADTSAINARTTAYWVVDGSRTQAPQHDNNVYVPFEQLQIDLGLAGGAEYQEVRPLDPANLGGPTTTLSLVEQPRTTEIHFKLDPDADLYATRSKVQAIVDEVIDQKDNILSRVQVETWEETQAMFLNAVENEITIMMTLFGFISIVAVFMIFCIFYTIVNEKTRDIGILKSSGASAWNVAQIFLTYGATIGFFGGGLGVLLGWAFVKNINEIQAAITNITGRTIYNSDIYSIDKLPDRVDLAAAVVIWVLAIAASVVGELVPAIFAARKRPVEALRFE